MGRPICGKRSGLYLTARRCYRLSTHSSAAHTMPKSKTKDTQGFKNESDPVDAKEQEVIDMLEEEIGTEQMSKTTFLTILRFVRGYSKEKHWQEKTLEMVKEFLKFREEKKVDELAEISPDDEGYKEFHKVWPHGLHGYGKEGHPIYIDRVGKIKPSELVAKVGIDQIIQYHIKAMEDLCNVKEEITKAMPEGERCYKHIVILDIGGIGMKHGSSKFRGNLKSTINIDQSYYPETLFKMFIVNSSWVFKALWAVASPWVDKVTKARIVWGTKTIHEYIDNDQLPKFLGGECKCEGECLQVPFSDGKPPRYALNSNADAKSAATPTEEKKAEAEAPGQEEGGNAEEEGADAKEVQEADSSVEPVELAAQGEPQAEEQQA